MMGHDGTWKSHMTAKSHHEVVVVVVPLVQPLSRLHRFGIVRGLFVSAYAFFEVLTSR